jgi:hypothetical protein
VNAFRIGFFGDSKPDCTGEASVSGVTFEKTSSLQMPLIVFNFVGHMKDFSSKRVRCRCEGCGHVSSSEAFEGLEAFLGEQIKSDLFENAKRNEKSHRMSCWEEKSNDFACETSQILKSCPKMKG